MIKYLLIILFSLQANAQYLDGVDATLNNYNTIINHQLNSGDLVKSEVLNKKFQVLNLKIESLLFSNYFADWTQEPLYNASGNPLDSSFTQNASGGITKTDPNNWFEVAAHEKIPLNKNGSISCTFTSGKRMMMIGLSKIRQNTSPYYQMNHTFFMGTDNILIKYELSTKADILKSNYGAEIKLTLERKDGVINYYIDDSLTHTEPESIANGPIGDPLFIVASFLYSSQSSLLSCELKIEN